MRWSWDCWFVLVYVIANYLLQENREVCVGGEGIALRGDISEGTCFLLRRNLWNIPKSYANECDMDSDPEPPVNELWEQNISTTSGAPWLQGLRVLILATCYIFTKKNNFRYYVTVIKYIIVIKLQRFFCNEVCVRYTENIL